MEKMQIETALAPDLGGLDPHGVAYNNVIYTSGQIGMDPRGNLPDTFEEQAKNAFYNLKAVVEAAGSRLDRMTKVTVYLTDMQNFATMNEVYGRFFRDAPPAREIMEVSALRHNSDIQVSAMGYVRTDT